MRDMVCLADGVMYSTDFAQTGINDNVIVAGTTGCGKTTSYTESRMLHTYDTSLVVPISKSRVKKQYADLFKQRGYKVIDLDYSNPEACEWGYDPLDYVESESDEINLAKSIVEGTFKGSEQGIDRDPYWNESTAYGVAAIISLIRINARIDNKRPSFYDVIRFADSIKGGEAKGSGSLFTTNMDEAFDKAQKAFPGNQASRLWKTISGNGPRTGGTILSMVQGAISGVFSDRVVEMLKKDQRIDFMSIGREKTVVFITTSPFDVSMNMFTNIMYANLFRALFEDAESRPEGRIDVPVHVICDDFACTGKIANFDRYISIFRAAGISTSLLLQSESQLEAMYGTGASKTIINNCDTYIYMGGRDHATCKNVSEWVNKPVNTVMSLAPGRVYVLRRGMRPIEADRYKTYEDPLYVEAFADKTGSKTDATSKRRRNSKRKDGTADKDAENER